MYIAGAMSLPPSRRHYLCLSVKKNILQQQADNGLSTAETATRNDVDRHQIIRWRNSEEKMMVTLSSRKTVHPGRCPAYDTHEPALLTFIEDRRANHQGITHN
jgi:hypothetical protein